MKPRHENWHESTIGNSGTVAADVSCPLCGQRVIYNGNYFCEDWGFVHNGKRTGGDCDWALPHPAVNDSDRAICDALGTDYR